MKILDGCYVEYAPDEVVNLSGANRGSIEPVESKRINGNLLLMRF